MWALPALMALALLPTVKNMLSGVCLSFPAAGTASIIRAVKTVQSLTIVTEWRITEMGSNWKLVSVCPHCGGRLTISIFYSFSRDHAVKLDGKLGKSIANLLKGKWTLALSIAKAVIPNGTLTILFGVTMVFLLEERGFNRET